MYMKTSNFMKTRTSIVLLMVMSLSLTSCQGFIDAIVGDTDNPSSSTQPVVKVGISYKKWDIEMETFVDAVTPGDYIEVDDVASNGVTWNGGWYVVKEDKTINGDLIINGEVYLLILDGKTLTINGKIENTTSSSLNILGQTTNTAKFVVNSPTCGIACLGDLTLSKVSVTSKGADATEQTRANGGISVEGNLNIYGSVVSALGGKGFDGDFKLGVRDGEMAIYVKKSMTIYSSSVTAEGGGTLFNEGNGGDGITIIEGNIDIHDSNLDAKGGDCNVLMSEGIGGHGINFGNDILVGSRTNTLNYYSGSVNLKGGYGGSGFPSNSGWGIGSHYSDRSNNRHNTTYDYDSITNKSGKTIHIMYGYETEYTIDLNDGEVFKTKTQIYKFIKI